VSSNPDDSAIVKSVIALAHSLRLRVVADGVENEDASFLTCDRFVMNPLFGLILTGRGMRRKALRFSALRALARIAGLR
jgi:predicted signal transduction protein with EAL and GGDEF domain